MGREESSPAVVHFFDEIEKAVVEFSQNEYCCRIVQRLFEKGCPKLIRTCAVKILKSFNFLSRNEFGVFVLSSLLDHGDDS
mmetsp:Transcript_5030/g.7561  ORF Transcript_5030/g.7561 Transcript_5030/m.7561 type:complete len:81 (-) Transcript_5030:718-960(-)